MDNIKVNGITLMSWEPRHILSTMLSSIPNLHLWSQDALVDAYIGMIDMVIEYCHDVKDKYKGGDKAKFTRFIKKAENMKKFIYSDQVRMVNKFYDTILANDGLGLLPHFGVSNRFGDSLKIDPERQTIRESKNVVSH